MTTMPLPRERFVELPAEVVPRLGPALAVLALADGVGEATPVGDPVPSATLAWVLATGAACPGWDGWPQPATTVSMAAAAALANAKRHRWRGCGAGISVLSFNHVCRLDNLQWSGRPEKVAR
jgi:hypothetical protein